MWKAAELWAVARLKEPSTYAGLAGVIASMTFLPHAQDVANAIPALGVGIGGLIAIVLAEIGAKP
jgi:hypothetical protein